MSPEQEEKILWLNRAFYTKNAVEALEGVRMEKQSMAVSCGINYENNGGKNGDSTNKQEKKLIDLCEINQKIDQAKQKLVLTHNEIEKVINNVENIDLRTVLTYHYLLYMTWENVAERMHYSVRTVKYKHKKALDMVELP